MCQHSKVRLIPYLELKMIVISKSESALYFDVDGTLVHHVEESRSGAFNVKCPYTGADTWLIPDRDHIRLLKKHSAIGAAVLVWSHGGIKWAEAVIHALELEIYVDAIVPKLERYVDDNSFGPGSMELIRIYMPNGWGKSVSKE